MPFLPNYRISPLYLPFLLPNYRICAKAIIVWIILLPLSSNYHCPPTNWWRWSKILGFLTNIIHKICSFSYPVWVLRIWDPHEVKQMQESNFSKDAIKFRDETYIWEEQCCQTLPPWSTARGVRKRLCLFLFAVN